MNSNKQNEIKDGINQNHIKTKMDPLNNFNFDRLSDDEKGDIANKVDNFLEALYLAPQLFNKDVIHALKQREEGLAYWRNQGRLYGFMLSSLIYAGLRISRGRPMFFKNYTRMFLIGVAFGVFAGRFAEYLGNKLYFRDVLFKIALTYNIGDEEIEDLHFRISQDILEENRNKQMGSSLDNVKFKL